MENNGLAVHGRGVEAELVRVSRKIVQVEQRLQLIDIEITQLKVSALYRLMVRVEEAEKEGRDLLAEMAANVNQQISDAKRRLVAAVAKKAGRPAREIILK